VKVAALRRRQQTRSSGRRKNARSGDFAPGQHLSLSAGEYPDVVEIAAAQTAALEAGEDPGCDLEDISVRYSRGECAVKVRKGSECWWIPVCGDTHLRVRLCIIAHMGPCGHRGVRTTFDDLSARFYWHGMREDVGDFLRQCLHCVPSKEGGRRIGFPDPMGWQCMGSAPPVKYFIWIICTFRNARRSQTTRLNMCWC